MSEVNDLLEQCLVHALHIRNISPMYVQCIRGTYGRFLADTGITTISECTRFRIEQWLLDGRIKKNWAAWTYRTEHKNLWYLFRYLLKRQLVSEDPMASIEVPKLPQTLPKGLTLEQAERLIEAARRARYANSLEPVRNTALVALMLFTWLRRNEVASLMMEDVDVWPLTANGVDPGSCGSMTIRVVQGKWKKDRVVPVSSRLAVFLREYLAARARLWRNCPSFFVKATRDEPLTWNAIRLMLGRMRKAVGFDFSPHTLRHTFATLMLEGNCDIYTLSRLMGHSKITTTTIYLSSSARLMASSVERHPLN